MWLGRLLFGARSFPGRQWTGKNRRLRKVTGHMRHNRLQKLLQIKRVEQMIAVPYLTVQEEHNHVIEKNLKELEEKITYERRMRNLGLDVLGLNSAHAKKDSKSFLEHLNVARKWKPVE